MEKCTLSITFPRHDLVNIAPSSLWVLDLEQISQFRRRYEICLEETPSVFEEAVCDPLAVIPSEYFL